MYKAMIVDDEALARYALKKLISNSFTDIEVIAEAESGRQAIELNKEHNPDIIAMDIKMPGINGIEASRQILRENPDTNILILTAYDNFNYIQQALDIGVKGYILKPIKKDEVVDKINKVIDGFKSKREKSQFKDYVENKINMVKPFLQKEIVAALISGNIDVNEVKSYTNFLQEQIEGGYFMLICVLSNSSSNINDSLRNKIFRQKVQEVAKRHLPLMRKCIFGHFIGNTIVTFFPMTEGSSESKVGEEAKVVAEEIKRKIKVITGLDVGIGIGSTYYDINKLKKSFDEANAAVKFSEHRSEVVHYCEMDSGIYKESSQYPLNLESSFLDRIRIGDAGKSREILKDITSYLYSNNFKTEILKDYMGQFITIVKRAALEIGVNQKDIEKTGLMMELNSLHEEDEIRVWFNNCVNKIIDTVESIKNNKDNLLINKILEYINLCFTKDITLESTSEHFGISPQYLSKLFKEQYGKNFIDYIIGERIKYAKQLLESGHKNVNEVGQKVGYYDANYFSRIFKKRTGVTPKQYRRNSIKKAKVDKMSGEV